MEIFRETFFPPSLSSAWFATRGCPSCLNLALTPVRALDEGHWLCSSCGRCWRVQHGILKPVDALTCTGCATRPKSECLARLGATFPRFGAGTPTDDDAFASNLGPRG
jgi:hypothetical protein